MLCAYALQIISNEPIIQCMINHQLVSLLQYHFLLVFCPHRTNHHHQSRPEYFLLSDRLCLLLRLVYEYGSSLAASSSSWRLVVVLGPDELFFAMKSSSSPARFRGVFVSSLCSLWLHFPVKMTFAIKHMQNVYTHHMAYVQIHLSLFTYLLYLRIFIQRKMTI